MQKKELYNLAKQGDAKALASLFAVYEKYINLKVDAYVNLYDCEEFREDMTQAAYEAILRQLHSDGNYCTVMTRNIEYAIEHEIPKGKCIPILNQLVKVEDIQEQLIESIADMKSITEESVIRASTLRYVMDILTRIEPDETIREVVKMKLGINLERCYIWSEICEILNIPQWKALQGYNAAIEKLKRKFTGNLKDQLFM